MDARLIAGFPSFLCLLAKQRSLSPGYPDTSASDLVCVCAKQQQDGLFAVLYFLLQLPWQPAGSADLLLKELLSWCAAALWCGAAARVVRTYFSYLARNRVVMQVQKRLWKLYRKEEKKLEIEAEVRIGQEEEEEQEPRS